MHDLFATDRSFEGDVDIAPGVSAQISEAPEICGKRITLDGGELLFSNSFLSRKISDRMLEYLQENESCDWQTADWSKLNDEIKSIEFKNVKWVQDYIKFFGKVHALPRLTSWYGDPGASYSYSGIKSEPNPWNRGLLYLKEVLEHALKTEFNSVLLNWYRDGADSLNWHADDEPELGPRPTIASLSFGESRDFLFRRRDSKRTEVSIKLDHGSLVVMKGDTQQNWVHSVPKRKTVRRSRFNLTFRYIADRQH